jgi:dihydrofolate reductase
VPIDDAITRWTVDTVLSDWSSIAIDGRPSTPLPRSSAWPDTDPHWRRAYGHVRMPRHWCDITIQEFHAATVKETPVSKLRVNAFSVSADGFGAGPDQGQDQPLGRGGEQLHQWFLPTRTFQRNVQRRDGGTTGIDDDFAARSFENLGAWIMGRNMFGPVRGPWPDYEWKGWWGANPPYHVPVFILTHHARLPLEMEGGTVFHFITEGIEAALDQARAAARGKDVRIGGGAATIRQYLQAGLLDEIHLAISPILLGQGESLLEGLDLPALGYSVKEHVSTEVAMHLVVGR